MKAIKVLLLAAVGAALGCAEEKYPASCGDLLAELHSKPEHLEFLECKPHPEDQTKPLVAEYRVKGIYAAAVERYLVKTFLPGQGQKKCCVPAPELPSVSFAWTDGKTYSLAFRADETGARNRAERSKVPHYVTFSREMEEP